MRLVIARWALPFPTPLVPIRGFVIGASVGNRGRGESAITFGSIPQDLVLVANEQNAVIGDSEAKVEIEFRAADEVRQAHAAEVPTYTPAFDVTPAYLVTGIITEHGIAAPQELSQLLGDLR